MMTCPKCGKPPDKRNEFAFFDMEKAIVGCRRCRMYAVDGDDQWFSRELSDEELDAALSGRAVAMVKAEGGKPSAS